MAFSQCTIVIDLSGITTIRSYCSIVPILPTIKILCNVKNLV